MDPPEYDYHSGPSAHVPSGGSYSYHSTEGTGYGPPPAPAVQPPAKPGGDKKGGGKKGSSALSALTLLSFLFFINLLQGCIKDHMDAMNPTVMVMTTNIIRNRFNKMGEMNSREQSSSYNSNSANIVMKPADLVAAAAAQSLSISTKPSVNLQSPYSSNTGSYNKPLEQNVPAQQPNSQYIHNPPEPELPISYAKPQYDPLKPDPYGYVSHVTPQQQAVSYNNHTLVTQPPPYKLPAVEQHYNYHHTEYSAPNQHPTQHQSNVFKPQYSIPQNPFYEHQHPVTSKPHGRDGIAQFGETGQDYNFPKNYAAPAGSTNNAYPWSSNTQSSSSVVSGPFRRASIISISPKTKWITVPAKITDRSHYDMNTDMEREREEAIEHYDDRDVFRSRFK